MKNACLDSLEQNLHVLCKKLGWDDGEGRECRRCAAERDAFHGRFVVFSQNLFEQWFEHRAERVFVKTRIEDERAKTFRQLFCHSGGPCGDEDQCRQMLFQCRKKFSDSSFIPVHDHLLHKPQLLFRTRRNRLPIRLHWIVPLQRKLGQQPLHQFPVPFQLKKVETHVDRREFLLSHAPGTGLEPHVLFAVEHPLVPSDLQRNLSGDGRRGVQCSRCSFPRCVRCAPVPGRALLR